MSGPFSLFCNAKGALAFTDDAGTVHDNVVPVRAFPLTAPDSGFSLVNAAGEELAWFNRLDELPAAARALCEKALECREFRPEIRKIVRVSSDVTPSVWTVETDRGPTRFTLSSEAQIRRLATPITDSTRGKAPHAALLITDSHGIQYWIRDRFALDRQSRRYLDRFL